jgi:PAS domain S-box-containing protein
MVQFYDEDSYLIEAVGRFAAQAIAAGDISIVIATPAHREALVRELEARGISAAALAEQGRYIALDATETLDTFMVDGWPDAARFQASVGALVARSVARCKGQLAAFGEMVALLWGEGKHDAAVHLERLWNDLMLEHKFSLLCGYPMNGFDREDHRRLFFSICGEHSHVNPTEEYPAQGSEGQRRRHVAKLQQKTRALETEIRLSQERVLILQKQADSGTWELDLSDETVSLSSAAARILGLRSGRLPLRELLALMYYSGDRQAVMNGIDKSRTGRKEFIAEFRLQRSGRTHVLSIRGKTVYNTGQPLILGVLSDVTSRFETPDFRSA